MNQYLQVLIANVIPSQSNLFAEISNEGMRIFFQSSTDNVITGLSAFTFENNDEEFNVANALQNIFDENQILRERFNKTFISYAFNQSILIPGTSYNAEQRNYNLDLIYGDLNGGIVFTDHVADKDIYNIYRVPEDVHLATVNQFREPLFIHQYSLLIKQLQYEVNMLSVIFYERKIVTVLLKGGGLQMIQTFSYLTADDVVYHILNVCSQFKVEPVNVQLCGAILKDSHLLRQIEKYFLNIRFWAMPEALMYTDEIKKYPSHFFSYLFSFALCV